MINNDNTALATVNTVSDRSLYRPKPRTVERKIGRATFIVSSRFNEGKEQDIVSTIARLIEHDSTQAADSQK